MDTIDDEMLPALSDLRHEFSPMFRLALPVVIAEMGWMTMGMVDTLMVGRISPEAIGAVGLGSSIFMGVCIFAMGLMLGLDTLVSQAFGARNVDECHRWLVHGVALATALSIPVTGGLLWIASGLDTWGIDPGVHVLAAPYVEVVAWSVLPLLLYSAFRRYLQGMHVVRPVTVALVAANLVNVIVNWILIYGKLGAPAMGVSGAAWATVLSRIVMAVFLFATILYRERGATASVFGSLKLEVAWFGRLLRLGVPAASQVTLEVGAFAAATALAGRLAPAALAAHQIAINYAALTFMVPLGISSAGAVRVGHAVGRGDAPGAARAGWTALLFGVIFMSSAAALFLVIPRLLLHAFTADERVLDVGVTLLFIAAVFQLFDGLQGVATGALRGLGDTRTPMFWNLAGHWFIGLPLGYTLCFVLDTGVVGLWWGLSIGLIICGVALSVVWTYRVNQLERALGVLPRGESRPI
jgi:multidrug resistance protein, MATE family